MPLRKDAGRKYLPHSWPRECDLSILPCEPPCGPVCRFSGRGGSSFTHEREIWLVGAIWAGLKMEHGVA